MNKLLSCFCPFSKQFHSLQDFKKINAGNSSNTLVLKVGIVALSVLVGVLSLSFGGFAVFRALVGRCTNIDPDSIEILRTDANPKITAKNLPSSKLIYEFCVSEVPPNKETLEKIAGIARKWKIKASDKEIDSKTYNDEAEIFSDSYNICKLIHQCMESPGETTYIWNKIFISKESSSKKIQAIALVLFKENKMTISHLAIHPKNIPARVNFFEKNLIRGAATSIIKHLKKLTGGRMKQIYLESTPLSKSFYKKMGFEVIKDHIPREWGTIPMSWTYSSQ